MTFRCPGQDMRNLRVALYKCPNCGAEVEIFSDELKVRCHKCGKYVYKDKISSCIDWCAAVRWCLGEERWQALQKDTVNLAKRKETGNDHQSTEKNRQD